MPADLLSLRRSGCSSSSSYTQLGKRRVSSMPPVGYIARLATWGSPINHLRSACRRDSGRCRDHASDPGASRRRSAPRSRRRRRCPDRDAGPGSSRRRTCRHWAGGTCPDRVARLTRCDRLRSAAKKRGVTEKHERYFIRETFSQTYPTKVPIFSGISFFILE